MPIHVHGGGIESYLVNKDIFDEFELDFVVGGRGEEPITFGEALGGASSSKSLETYAHIARYIARVKKSCKGFVESFNLERHVKELELWTAVGVVLKDSFFRKLEYNSN